MNEFHIIGYLAGTLTTIAIVPQIIKLLKTKEAGDISIPTFIVMMLGVGLWAIYGFIISDLPVIIFNSICFLLNAWHMFLLRKYK